jgi:hypothetical protein
VSEVLYTCQNAGLHVIATVCDMGTNNFKALKLLGVTKRKPSLMFCNQKISTVYNPEVHSETVPEV